MALTLGNSSLNLWQAVCSHGQVLFCCKEKMVSAPHLTGLWSFEGVNTENTQERVWCLMVPESMFLIRVVIISSVSLGWDRGGRFPHMGEGAALPLAVLPVSQSGRCDLRS